MLVFLNIRRDGPQNRALHCFQVGDEPVALLLRHIFVGLAALDKEFQSWGKGAKA